MAVYTEVSDEELEAFVAEYDIGTVDSCKGIAEGVENSNYLLQTDRAAYILTLYEKRVARDDLPFFLGLWIIWRDIIFRPQLPFTEMMAMRFVIFVTGRQQLSAFFPACGHAVSHRPIAVPSA